MPPIIIAFYGLLLYGVFGFFSLYIDFANYLKFLAIGVVLYAYFKAPKNYRFDSTSVGLKLFVVLTIFIVLRGSIIGFTPVFSWHRQYDLYQIVRYFFVFEYSALSFVLMLFVLVPFNIKELRYYRSITYISFGLTLFNIFLFKDNLFDSTMLGRTGIFIGEEEVTIRNLISLCFIGFGFILLFCYSIKSFRRNSWDYLPFIILILYALSQIAGGGRGGTITALLYLAFALYFFYNSSRGKAGASIIVKLLIVVGAIYAVYYLFVKTEFFSFFLSRMFEGGEVGGDLVESSREYFTKSLYEDLNRNPLGWVFGYGVNGAFEVPGNGLRSSIEWGYWYLILKGGVPYLLVYVYVLLKSAYLGFFRSNNGFSKAMAVLCLMTAYSLIPFGLPGVSLQFLLIWHYLRLINTASVRAMSDTEIARLINSNYR